MKIEIRKLFYFCLVLSKGRFSVAFGKNPCFIHRISLRRDIYGIRRTGITYAN